MASIGITTRRGLLGAAAGLALPTVARGQAQVQAKTQPLTQLAIATGTTGGVYYPLGGGMANILSRTVPGLSATVEVTGGSVGNLQLLGTNRVGMGFSQVDAAVNAYEGDDRFRGKPVPIRTVAVLYTNRMQLVTTAATGIKSVADLRGKRISTGAPGSATEGMAFRLLVSAGLDRDKDLRARERLSPAESTNAIKDGKLDAYFFVSGIPTSAITDLGATPGTQLVLVDHAEFAPRIIARHGPVYFPETIPAGTYPGQKTPNQQISVANTLVVLDSMPDSHVTTILSTLWAAREDLIKVHSEARNFTLAGQKTASAGVPWHPAAEAFWATQGAVLG